MKRACIIFSQVRQLVIKPLLIAQQLQLLFSLPCAGLYCAYRPQPQDSSAGFRFQPLGTADSRLHIGIPAAMVNSDCQLLTCSFRKPIVASLKNLLAEVVKTEKRGRCHPHISLIKFPLCFLIFWCRFCCWRRRKRQRLRKHFYHQIQMETYFFKYF